MTSPEQGASPRPPLHISSQTEHRGTVNKTVRSLCLLYRCYGRTVPADELLDLFADGTTDVNTQRRTLRRYLVDFRRAGVEARWSGRGAHATVHIPAHENSSAAWEEMRRAAATVGRLLEENAVLLRRLGAEREANNVFRNLLRRRS